MALVKKPEHTWIEIEGVDGAFRIALVFHDEVAIIVNEKEDLPLMPENTKRLTATDLDGDLLVEVPVTWITRFLTDQEVDEECEEEEAAA
jgi:hypothetical protein